MKKLDKLKQLYLNSRTRRYHTRPEINQNVKEHSFGVALIISTLHPNPSANLLKAAILHDCPEGVYGDFLAPAKDKFPEIAEFDKRLAELYWEEIGIRFPELDEEEKIWLEFADRYECVLFGRSCVPEQTGMYQKSLSVVKQIVRTFRKEYECFNEIDDIDL